MPERLFYHTSATWKSKIWALCESPIVWGGIGLLGGAVGVIVSFKVMFGVAALTFLAALWRANLFGGKRVYTKIIGLLALGIVVCGILFGIWLITPKPKEPPSAEAIAEAVIKKERADIRQNQSSLPPHGPVERTSNNKTQHPSGSKNKQRIVAKPIQTAIIPPPSAPPPSPQPPKVIVSQKEAVSSREDAPYKTEVTVQATTDFPSLKLVISCDKPLIAGAGGLTGLLLMSSHGILKDHQNIFVFTYQSATPPFGPSNPITISLWSKEPIACTAATF